MNELQLLVFRIEDHYFTVPISKVARVVDTLQSKSMPLLNTAFEGLFIFDNRLVPIIRLAEQLGFYGSNIYNTNLDESVIILNSEGYFFGFRVDAIEGIEKVLSSEFHPVTADVAESAGIKAEIISSWAEITGATVYLVDTDRLLSATLFN